MKKTAGMYEIDEGTIPVVKIGKYRICRQDDKSVWIQHETGEGAQFADDMLEAVIEKFYRDNF